MRKILLASSFAALGLTACGGSGYSGASAPMMPTPTPPPAAMLDPYTQSVTAVVAATSDTREADPIDTIALSKPDDTEPTSI